MKTVWNNSGNSWLPGESSNQHDRIPVAVYKVMEDAYKNLYLNKIQEKFAFSYKLYDLEQPFVSRVVKTYENTLGNLGVLLNGVKRTGKTVTAETICNELGLPVIIVSGDFEKLTSFINDFQQDVVFFFDEFEKVFASNYREGSKLLTVMDGALKTKYRKVFLLTTNSLSIDDNFVQRPGRIRYLKTFGNLGLGAINHIVDDKLLDSQKREEVITFISRLEIITVDIVCSVVEEVNIHNQLPEEFAPVFNVKKINSVWDVYKVEVSLDGSLREVVRATSANISPRKEDWENDNIADFDFYVNRSLIGAVKSVSDYCIVVDESNSVDDYYDGDTSRKPEKLVTYRVEPAFSVNPVFKRMAL